MLAALLVTLTGYRSWLAPPLPHICSTLPAAVKRGITAIVHEARRDTAYKNLDI